MLIIPAIDLKDRCVVRYVQGKLNKKVYSTDPVKTAKHWVKAGAQFLHIVDLDGAFTGIASNIDIAKDIAKNINIPVQFGGGVREISIIEALLEAGIQRVVLGTKAVEDKVFLQAAFDRFKKHIIVSIDALEGNVLIKGWQADYQGMDAQTFAHNLSKIGFKEAIYTDTAKDGTLSGPNISGVKSLLKDGSLKLIASGGISSLEDIRKLKKLANQGLLGVIIGKALYEGKFTLSEALDITS